MSEATVFLILSICIIINISFKTKIEFDYLEEVISSGKKNVRAKMITRNNARREKAWKVNKKR